MSLPAQRLYNEAQDKRAQEAVAASALIRDSSVFEKALTNLTLVQRLQQDNLALGAQNEMRSNVLSWTDWEAVQASMDTIRKAISADPLTAGDQAEWNAAIPRLQQQQKDMLAQIQALKDRIEQSNPDGRIKDLGDVLAQVGRLTPIFEYLSALANNANPSTAELEAVRKAGQTLNQLSVLYQKFSSNIPARPSVLYANYQLQLLRLEEQHYKNLIAIDNRRRTELEPITKLSRQVLLAITQHQLQGDIAGSLRAQAASVAAEADPTQKAAKRQKLDEMLTALLHAATVAARGAFPASLAAQRETLEVRAHALARSRQAATAYEDLVSTGTQRLSAYYKGGIRPRTLAELLHTLVSAGLIPAVLQR